ncbi:MAG TPA: LysM peptidoglycan-binding domain-containing protein [Patescibacteria group bacterium]|nr:LysM peptidoglycan-binding domain-containing protein [Patescibacteria group bacterium]
MPRKKEIVKKTSKRGRPAKAVDLSRQQKKSKGINWTESYSSFLLGVVVVIIAILFGVTLIRQQSHTNTKEASSLSTGPTPTAVVSPTPGTTVQENGNTYYIVKQNDSLWTIAQSVYNNGYKWTDIASVNHIANPSTIFTGDKLLMPNAPKPSELGQMLPTTQTDKITANTYTVKKDDSLWDIAVRAYGDGYQWVKIANANHLANPDMIFSGNVLTLPR